MSSARLNEAVLSSRPFRLIQLPSSHGRQSLCKGMQARAVAAMVDTYNIKLKAIATRQAQ